MTAAADPVQYRVIGHVGERVGAAELGVEVGCVLVDLGQGVVDLVVAGDLLGGAVFDGYPGAPAERHLPEAIDPVVGIDRNWQSVDLRELLPRLGEEIAYRDLDGGVLLVVPVKAQDAFAAHDSAGEPDALDRARTGDVGQFEHLAGLDPDRRGDLPAFSQVGRRSGPEAFRRHSPAPGRSVGAFGADRAGPGVGKPRQIAQMQAQSVETTHGRIPRFLCASERAAGRVRLDYLESFTAVP